MPLHFGQREIALILVKKSMEDTDALVPLKIPIPSPFQPSLEGSPAFIQRS